MKGKKFLSLGMAAVLACSAFPATLEYFSAVHIFHMICFKTQIRFKRMCNYTRQPRDCQALYNLFFASNALSIAAWILSWTILAISTVFISLYSSG